MPAPQLEGMPAGAGVPVVRAHLPRVAGRVGPVGRRGGGAAPRAHALPPDGQHPRVQARPGLPRRLAQPVARDRPKGDHTMDDGSVRLGQDDHRRGAGEAAAVRAGQERLPHRRRQSPHRPHTRPRLLPRRPDRVCAPGVAGGGALLRGGHHHDGDAHLAVPQGPRRRPRDARRSGDPLHGGLHGRSSLRRPGTRPKGAL
mmetsp:Transcript_5553/g.18422  ORF Transcript_5553/g.18422 Transcript_5553/m.18422 type:complete len:200 (-) Transcript_5553:2336-2935(-)